MFHAHLIKDSKYFMSAGGFVGRPVLAVIHQTHTAHTDLVLLCQSATNVPGYVVTEGADR